MVSVSGEKDDDDDDDDDNVKVEEDEKTHCLCAEPEGFSNASSHSR